jgi:predicted dehydrogenase
MDEGAPQTMKPNPEKKQDAAETPQQSRRDFLKVAGAAAVVGALAPASAQARPRSAWNIAPLPARSYSRVLGANDRVRLGVIGVGMMGRGHVWDFVGMRNQFGNQINAEITAVCEVYQPRLDAALKMAGGAEGFTDYRDLMTSGLVDGVIVATPEHWHYPMAKDALACNLDLFLQKPMTRTHEEALDLYRRFSRSDRVFQLGSQYCQTPAWWRARELYEQGALGTVVMAQTSYQRNSLQGEWNYTMDEGARPGENLDWEAWLGPLPRMKYDPEYFFRWRKYRQFSSGIISDLLPHKLHSLAYVMGAAEIPLSASTVGGNYVQHDRTVADTCVVTLDYGHYLMMLTGATCNEQGLEDMIRGNEASLYIGTNSVRVLPERPYADLHDLLDERCDPAPLNANKYHVKEFVDCMRSRTQPTWNAEASYNVMTAIAMAERSWLTGKTVRFDPKRELIYAA